MAGIPSRRRLPLSPAPAKQLIMGAGDPPYLPEEIIRIILKRLPVKSLVRFQCVRKRWRNLFKTSSFIEDHLRHSHQNSSLLFYCYGGCDECFPGDLYSFHSSLVDRQMQICKVQSEPWIYPMTALRIINSSNGLLCVRPYDNNLPILLCNLAIRDVRPVPKPPNCVDKEFHIGFGFNPVVSDYRIVGLCCAFFDDPVYGVLVFSVGTGSWKKVEVGNLEGVTLMNRDGFNTDGFLFWFGLMPGESDRHLIVSFDLAIEVFTLIPMPPIHFKLKTQFLQTNFTVYHNKLAVLHPVRRSNSCLIELWVMEEDPIADGDGERERWSWTKKYSSNPYPCLLSPRTIWGNEIVCRIDLMFGLKRGTEGEVEDLETKTLLINLTTNEFKTFAHRVSSYHVSFNHVESLVKVNNVPSEEPELDHN